PDLVRPRSGPTRPVARGRGIRRRRPGRPSRHVAPRLTDRVALACGRAPLPLRPRRDHARGASPRAGVPLGGSQRASGTRSRLVMPEPRLVHTDEWLAVVDKPAGLIVHAAPGHSGPTLVGVLGNLLGGGGDPARPGIVHRLDKDTSGLMIVARTDEAH